MTKQPQQRLSVVVIGEKVEMFVALAKKEVFFLVSLCIFQQSSHHRPLIGQQNAIRRVTCAGSRIADILQHDFSPLFDLRVKGRNSLHAVEHSKGAGWGQQRADHAGAVNLYHFKTQFFHLAGIIKSGNINIERFAHVRRKYRRLFISVNHRACIHHRDVGLCDTMQPQTAGRG